METVGGKCCFSFQPWKLRYSKHVAALIWDLAPLMEWNDLFARAMMVRKEAEAAEPGEEGGGFMEALKYRMNKCN